MLAAYCLGLGSCVVGSAAEVLNSPIIKANLGIPAEFKAVAPIIVGVPSGETAASSRNEPYILTWKQ
jgi:nitroreductase